MVVGAGARAADAPDSDPAPPAITPVAPPPSGAALEAGDTAPTTAAPALAAQQQPFVDPGLRPLTPRPEPFYRKPWFWGGVAALCLTAAIVGTFALGNSEAPTPRTTLGNMHAF